MKYISIPEDIKLGNDGEKDVFQKFTDWLTNPLNGAQFGMSGATLRMSVKIESRFAGKKVGEVVHLDDKEWALLNDAAENPKSQDPRAKDVVVGFITHVAKVFLPFMDAVADAVDEEPAGDVTE